MEKVEAARLIPQERSQQRTVEEIVEILVPQIQVIRQERVSERVVEQIVAVLQIQEHDVEVRCSGCRNARGRDRGGGANHSFGALACGTTVED